MITDEQFKQAENATMRQLLNADPATGACVAYIGAAISKFSPAAVHTAMALLFGTLCVDAEMNGCESDATGIVTLDQRLKLFDIIARVSYKESAAEIKASGLYNQKAN